MVLLKLNFVMVATAGKAPNEARSACSYTNSFHTTKGFVASSGVQDRSVCFPAFPQAARPYIGWKTPDSSGSMCRTR